MVRTSVRTSVHLSAVRDEVCTEPPTWKVRSMVRTSVRTSVHLSAVRNEECTGVPGAFLGCAQ